jgi:hypothetical protein
MDVIGRANSGLLCSTDMLHSRYIVPSVYYSELCNTGIVLLGATGCYQHACWRYRSYILGDWPTVLFALLWLCSGL